MSMPHHPTTITCLLRFRRKQFHSLKQPRQRIAQHTYFKMSVLTPIPVASNLLASSSTGNVLAILSPALTNSIYFATILQRLLSTTTLFVAFRAYLLSLVLLRQSFYTAQIILMQGYRTSALLANQLFLTAKQTMKLSWRATEAFRNKLFFEFMVFILGGGNTIFLVVFWPGWLVIGGVWGIWWMCG